MAESSEPDVNIEEPSEPKVNIEEPNEPNEPSEYEIAARTARAKHSTATVSLLQSCESLKNSEKIFTGNAFVIRLDQQGGSCKLITCYHLIAQNLSDKDYVLWARFFDATEDVKATVARYNIEKDIAILDIAELPQTKKHPPTVLEFSRKRRIGETVTLLGYFNPDSVPELIWPGNLIAKAPNALPGVISGPLALDTLYPEQNWLLPIDNYGIFGSCGSPIIAHDSGKAVAMFKQSINQIHFGIATKTIREQLREWLKAPKEDTLEEMINRL